MQTSLLGLAIALILALLAALVGPLFIDWNQYRPAFEAQASRVLGSPVRVSGPIDVRLLPSPSLLLNRIEIGSDAAQQPLRARALGIELALGSLIRGQLRATELRLVGPDVAVSLDRDGRLNGPNPTAGLNLNDVSIGRLSIEDARLSLAHAASGKQVVLDKLWFGGDVRSLGAGIFRGEGAFVVDGALYGYRIASARPDDGDARIKLSLEPSEIPLVIESDGTLSFSDAVPRFEGAMTLMRPVGIALAGGRTVIGEPWRVTSRVTATPASALFEQLELQYGPEERALKATGTAEMILGENPHVEAVVSARQIDADRALASQDQPRRNPVSATNALITMASKLSHSPIPVQIGFGIDGVTLGGGSIQSLRGDVVVNDGGFSLRGVELRAPGFTQIKVSGRLTTADGPSFSGPVDVSSVDPRAFVAWLDGKSEPASGTASPLRGRGDIVIDDNKVAIERLAFEIDRKPVHGRVAYMYGSGARKARLDAQLKAADADIDAMMALAGAVLKDTKVERPDEVSLALDIERARFASLDAQGAHVQASFDSAGLKIERLSINDFGGTRIEASGVIDTAAALPRGSMTASVEARDLSGLTALVAKFAPQSLDQVRSIAERARHASLRAALEVDTPAGAQQSQLRLDLSGRLGGARLRLTGSAAGTMADPAKAQVQAEAELADDNAAELLRIAGFDRFIAVDGTPGKVTVSASGPLNGDLRFDARASANNLDARGNGRLRLFSDQGLAGDFDVAIARADAGALLQPMQSLPVALSGRAVLAGSRLTLHQASAQIAGTPLRGRLGLTFGSAVEVEGEVETDAIDATALIAAASGVMAGGKLPSEEPFARGLFSRTRGEIAFRAKSAELTEALVMHGVKGVLRLAPSDLGVDIEEAEFAKGRLSGEFLARRMADGTSAKARLTLTGADAGLLVPGSARPPVSGRINLSAELDGAGRSPKALIGSLSGTGALTLAGVRIEGLDPKAFAAAMHAVDQGLPLDGMRVRGVVTPALDRGALAVRVAEVPFTVSGGIVRFGTLLAQADGADVAMSGALDLTKQTIESRIMLTDTAAETSAGRPQITMQLKGPVAAPARNIDVAALTGWLALRAVEQQSRKLEAIEHGGVPPATSSVPPASSAPPPIMVPERSPILPRTRPAAEVRTPAAPLPPPMDIKPPPGFAPAQSEQRRQSRPAPQFLAPPPRGSSF